MNGNLKSPIPPDSSPLPNHEEHRRELLAAIRAESEGAESRHGAGSLQGMPPGRTAGRPAWLRPSWLRPSWLRPSWMGPVAAAAAVLVVVAGVIGVRGLVQSGSGSPAAGQSVRPTATGSAAGSPAGPVAGAITTKPVRTSGGQWTVTTSFTVTAAVTSLVINDPTGPVTVTGGNTSRVSVAADISYTATAPAVTRSLSLAATLTLGYSGCGDCGVGFRVTVPSGTNVRVVSGIGSVTLSGIRGSVDVQAGAGNVTATGLAGLSDQFRVGTGRIDAAFTEPPSRVDAVAGTGSVTIEVPSSAVYQVAASSQLGATTVTVPQAEHSSHVITAQVSTGSVTVSGG